MPWTHHDTRKANELTEKGWRARKKAEAEMESERTRANWMLKHAEDYSFWLGRIEGAKAAGLEFADYEERAAECFQRLQSMVQAQHKANCQHCHGSGVIVTGFGLHAGGDECPFCVGGEDEQHPDPFDDAACAERYRWLRQSGNAELYVWAPGADPCKGICGEALDAAVDAAMAAEAETA